MVRRMLWTFVSNITTSSVLELGVCLLPELVLKCLSSEQASFPKRLILGELKRVEHT